MNEKVKVCMITKNLILNGISTIVTSYCDNLPDEIYDITILTGEQIADKYMNKYQNSNIKIVSCPSKQTDKMGYYKAIYRYLSQNKVDIVHVHGSSSVCCIEMALAKICGVKKRIMHSHNTTCDNQLVHKILKPIMLYLSTTRCACGEAAGKWLYGDKSFTIIPNSFNTEKFSFDIEKRNKIRRELQLSDEVVVGHIGLFNHQKNHIYILKVFEEYEKLNKNTVLLLVGNGGKFEEIKELVNSKSYKNKVIFFGTTDDAPSMYSAMDIFLFPSLFEGLPVALLEAQTNGLQCLVSDTITKEVYLNGNAKWLSIKESPKLWAKEIKPVSIDERLKFYEKNQKFITKYKIENTIKILEKIYMQ